VRLGSENSDLVTRSAKVAAKVAPAAGPCLRIRAKNVRNLAAIAPGGNGPHPHRQQHRQFGHFAVAIRQGRQSTGEEGYLQANNPAYLSSWVDSDSRTKSKRCRSARAITLSRARAPAPEQTVPKAGLPKPASSDWAYGTRGPPRVGVGRVKLGCPLVDDMCMHVNGRFLGRLPGGPVPRAAAYSCARRVLAT